MYKAFRFADAGKVYTIGLGELAKSDHPTDIAIRPVLLSNRGAIRFERGDYAGAAQDSRDALLLISSSGDTDSSDNDDNNAASSRSKNQLRLASALFYGNDGRKHWKSSLVPLKILRFKRKCVAFSSLCNTKHH